ncbi:MAG: C-terminal helicase domain-containing protein, partial [bacterium]
NSALMSFSSRSFYKGRMRAAKEVADLTLPVRHEALASRSALMRDILSPKNPVVLINIRGREVMRQNEQEARMVLTVLRELLSDDLLTYRGAPRHFDPETVASQIGIIAPFRGQVQLLRRFINEAFPVHCESIEVATVERFQGREKEIMLVSFVASGRTSGFIANPRRLNVTLTRARTKLIIFGDLRSLSLTSGLFRDLITQDESLVLEGPEDGIISGLSDPF